MLKVSLIQMYTAQGDISANLSHAETLIAHAAKHGAQLVCLPEMWTTGFHFILNQKICVNQDDTLSTVCQYAQKHGVWISGSMLYYSDSKKPTNSHFLIDDTGNVQAHYDKVHLFSLAKEDQFVEAGNHLSLVDTPWGKTGLAVCYDLRFPEMFRQYALQGAELIICPAAFPNPRLEHWKTLIKARAIENQLFMIATNQIATEQFDFGNIPDQDYFGHSRIIDPWGETIIESSSDIEEILSAELDINMSTEVRAKMSVLADRRPDVYNQD